MQTDAPQTLPHPVYRYIQARQLGDPAFGVTAFCDMCGISRTSYYRLIEGAEDVGNALFEKIETATRGVLTATELYAAWLHAKRNPRPKADAEERAPVE